MTAPRGGQQVAEEQAAAMYMRDEASRSLGITVSEVGPGRATASLTVTPAMVNGHGIAHGGYVFLLADTAFAFACNTYGETVVARQAEIAFLAPVRAGQLLRATAAERVRRGRSGVYDVTVRSEDGAAVAEFRGHSRVVADARAPDT